MFCESVICHEKLKNVNMRLIHFFTDEKFTGFMIYLFGQFKNIDQKYILVKKDKDQRVNFRYDNLEYIVLDELNYFVNNYSPDCVIFHSLFNFNLKVLNELKIDTKVCWYSWGGDLALAPVKEFIRVHEPETLSIYYKSNNWTKFKSKILDRIKVNTPYLFNKYYKFRTGEEWDYYLLKRNLNKISIVNTVTFSEKEIFKKSQFKGKFIHIPIGTIELFLGGIDIEKKTNTHDSEYPTVFLGHSAYSENNQFDVFKALKDNNFKGQIICPVSYGSKEYAEKLIEYGTGLFGRKVTFIKDYLSQKEYNTQMQKADFYINNSIIQQGVGNLITALYIGKKVFLNEKGKVYEYLLHLGIKPFSIQKDLKMCNDFFENKENLSVIRKNIDDVYLEKNVINKLTVFLNEINK